MRTADEIATGLEEYEDCWFRWREHVWQNFDIWDTWDGIFACDDAPTEDFAKWTVNVSFTIDERLAA